MIDAASEESKTQILYRKYDYFMTPNNSCQSTFLSVTPPPRFWGDLIFKNAGFLGGTCDFEKKVGVPPVPGGTYF